MDHYFQIRAPRQTNTVTVTARDQLWPVGLLLRLDRLSEKHENTNCPRGHVIRGKRRHDSDAITGEIDCG